MPAAVPTLENLSNIADHGHPEMWELVIDVGQVYVECTKCGVPIVVLCKASEVPEDNNPNEIFT